MVFFTRTHVIFVPLPIEAIFYSVTSEVVDETSGFFGWSGSELEREEKDSFLVQMTLLIDQESFDTPCIEIMTTKRRELSHFTYSATLLAIEYKSFPSSHKK